MIRRVLVANRGEIAVRVIRACHELGIEAVAVYSTADRDSLAVRLADRAVCIGPPPPSLSYLNQSNVLAAAETTGCDAIHPGYGFLSENADFVRLCAENDVIFIGPSPEIMEVMGDKASAKDAMRAAGLPLVPGSPGRLASAAEAMPIAAAAGYPVLLKAAAGGGGRGMRLVERPEDLADLFTQASQEAQAAFGDGGMYLEKAVVAAHHVEIQVMCDGQGGVLICGERECSIQRRHQKLLEEAPSPFLDHATREAMAEAAERACRHIGYRNAGTIEFLVGADRAFYFMEMNTRLQVEHPVTEAVTGIDLVRQQLRVASGLPLEQTGRAVLRGHAIELRLNAEDPSRNFMPSAGTMTRFRPPLGPGVRVDTHAYEGYRIPPNYDSLVAKVICWAESREACIERALRALSETEVEGVATTRDLFADILREARFRGGTYTTAYLADAAADLPSLVTS
jgi:acetyl-CoA carboxylase biotin carboxylase subunit